MLQEIHAQDGLAILPHPYKGHNLEKIPIDEIDAIETFNSRVFPANNRKAANLSKRHNKTSVAGSDAHFLCEIGKASIITESTDVRSDIEAGRLRMETSYSPQYMESLSQAIKSLKDKRYGKIPQRLLSPLVRSLRA